MIIFDSMQDMFRQTIVILFVLLCYTTYGQNERPPRPALEFDVGINHAISKNTECEFQHGFDCSFKTIWHTDKMLNFVTGISFDNIRYFRSYFYGGHYYHYKDVKFQTYVFSIPIQARINFGKTYKIFAEAGTALNLIPCKKGNAKIIEEEGLIIHSESEHKITEDFDYEMLDFAATTTLGASIPIKNIHCVISMTYYNIFASIYRETLQSSKEMKSISGIDFIPSYAVTKIGILF